MALLSVRFGLITILPTSGRRRNMVQAGKLFSESLWKVRRILSHICFDTGTIATSLFNTQME
jgi:hypothetical protein